MFILVYIFSEYKMMDDDKEADEKNLLNIQILPGSYREVGHWNLRCIKFMFCGFSIFNYYSSPSIIVTNLNIFPITQY